MLKAIPIAFLLALSQLLAAQLPDTVSIVRSDSVASSTSLRSDSVEAPRVLREWSLSRDFSEEVQLPFDTVFSMFHRYRLAERYSPLNAYMGNYGLPMYQLNFFDRVTDPDKFLYSSYYPFMWTPEKALFMNTQVPFSELVWTFAGTRENSEQTFRVRHSQNVNRFLNFGVIYDIVFNLGQYGHQRAENKDFTLYSSYTGEKYKMYFSAGINNLTSNENGGVISINDIESKTNMRDVPVNLGTANNAVSVLKNRSLLLVQRYTIGGRSAAKADSGSTKKPGFLGLSGTFSHILTIDANKRTYSDEYPKSGFYDTIFFNKGKSALPFTFDSLSSRNIQNTVRFDFTTDETRKVRLGAGVGIRSEIFRYGQIIPTHDTAHYADTATWHRSSNAVIGKLYNNIGDKFRWVANGELYLSGFRAGDFSLDGVITKSFDFKKGRASLDLTGGISATQPSFWYEHWGSNHFEWNVNLKKEVRINTGASFSFPGRKTSLRFDYAIIDNYTYFDLTAHPVQHTGGLSVISVQVSKDLHAWKFHLAPDVLIQKSSNNTVLDLPLVAFRAAGYFEHFFVFKSTGGDLNTQIGADLTWHSPYHAFAYMPATGRFYNQDKYLAGNYPFVNVFFNFKVRRTRAFIMFDHVNSRLMGYNFSMIPSYPMNIRMLRYGLAWTFYD